MLISIKIVICNSIWFISCLKRWLFFHLSTLFPEAVQQKILKTILKKNRNTIFGKDNNFKNIHTLNDLQMLSLTEYNDYNKYIKMIFKGKKNVLTKDQVLLLEPTSGSSSPSKLIPYTKSLKKQFRNAIDPWIAELFLNYPSLFFRTQYWSISPNTIYPSNIRTDIRIGFEDDSEYLSPVQKILSRTILTVPVSISKLKDITAFEYVTLLFLIKDKKLGFISIWSPSFLLNLIEKIPVYFNDIINDISEGAIKKNLDISKELRQEFTIINKPNSKRAKELNRINTEISSNIQNIWPGLRIISCWSEAYSANLVYKIKEYFPNVIIQGKGLVTTESIVSIPIGKGNDRVLALRSHFFEFIDCNKEEVRYLWNLENNRSYYTVVTSRGGLYRYKLHDIIHVDGFINKTPLISFISKDDIFSDLVGEKINVSHITNILNKLKNIHSIKFNFSMLATYNSNNNIGYCLFVEENRNSKNNYNFIKDFIEKNLKKNYHYNHARRLKQLSSLKLFIIKQGTAYRSYQNYFVSKGIKIGDIKISYLRKEIDWDKYFNGKYITLPDS